MDTRIGIGMFRTFAFCDMWTDGLEWFWVLVLQGDVSHTR